MADPLGPLVALLARVRGLPGVVAARARGELLEVARETAQAGRGPEGRAWAPRREGGQALARAADHLSVRGSGLALVFRLVGPEAFHGAKRPVLPTALPARWGEVLQRLAVAEWERLCGPR